MGGRATRLRRPTLRPRLIRPMSPPWSRRRRRTIPTRRPSTARPATSPTTCGSGPRGGTRPPTGSRTTSWFSCTGCPARPTAWSRAWISAPRCRPPSTTVAYRRRSSSSPRSTPMRRSVPHLIAPMSSDGPKWEPGSRRTCRRWFRPRSPGPVLTAKGGRWAESPPAATARCGPRSCARTSTPQRSPCPGTTFPMSEDCPLPSSASRTL